MTPLLSGSSSAIVDDGNTASISKDKGKGKAVIRHDTPNDITNVHNHTANDTTATTAKKQPTAADTSPTQSPKRTRRLSDSGSDGTASRIKRVSIPPVNAELWPDMTELELEDARLAHRMWAYLDKRQEKLEDGQRIWLNKFTVLKDQEDVLRRHDEELKERALANVKLRQGLIIKAEEMSRQSKVLQESSKELFERKTQLHEQKRAFDKERDRMMQWIQNDKILWDQGFGKKDKKEQLSHAQQHNFDLFQQALGNGPNYWSSFKTSAAKPTAPESSSDWATPTSGTVGDLIKQNKIILTANDEKIETKVLEKLEKAYAKVEALEAAISGEVGGGDDGEDQDEDEGEDQEEDDEDLITFH